ncbi:MAG: sensor histidine kinase [Pseudobdellovibrionaceae bacterium]
MKNNKVQWYLFSTLFVMTLLPFLSSLYFLDQSLNTSLNLGFNSSVTRALELSSSNLKELKKYNPQHEEKYRQQFQEITELSDIYSNPEQIKNTVLGSLKLYFLLGLAFSVLLSLIVASTLSRRVAKIYQMTFEDLLKQKEQVLYLKEVSAWQQMAQMLAHEIRNPLTPIELVITSLKRSFESIPSAEFKELLKTTEAIVLEELGHLRRIVGRFGEFAKVPQVQLRNENITLLIQQLVTTLASSFPSADIRLNSLGNNQLAILVDTSLIRQVLANLIRNGLEANSNQRLRFDLNLEARENQLHIDIMNYGVPVPIESVDRIFEPSFSTHPTKDNMGLGLAIVRKILLEHRGDIIYREENQHPIFTITLPLSGDQP